MIRRAALSRFSSCALPTCCMLTSDSRHVVTSRCEQDGFVDAGCASRHGLLFYFRRGCDHGDHLVNLYAYGALIWRHADCLRVPPLQASLRGLRRLHCISHRDLRRITKRLVYPHTVNLFSEVPILTSYFEASYLSCDHTHSLCTIMVFGRL